MTDILQKGVVDMPERKQVRFPRLPLFTAVALIGFVLALTLFGRLTDIGTVRVPLGEPVAVRDITILSSTNHAAIVDTRSRQTIAEVNHEGFVFGVIRGLERTRMTRSISADQPYRLIKWQNGWISLSDTVTGERIYLNAFGPDNAADFEQFL